MKSCNLSEKNTNHAISWAKKITQPLGTKKSKQKAPKLLKIDQIGTNSSQLLQIAPSGSKWLQITLNGSKGLWIRQMAMAMVQHCPKWSQIVPNVQGLRTKD